MATARDVRRIALSLEGTLEAPHFDRTAFNARGPCSWTSVDSAMLRPLRFNVARIYATLPRDGETVNLLFSVDDEDRHCADNPGAFAPVPGGWGRMGYTTVTLSALSTPELAAAMKIAWIRAPPKPKMRPKRA
jgi:hypothetical protein